MRKRTDRWRAAAACVALCGVLTACGQKEMAQDLKEPEITAEASEGENGGESGKETEIAIENGSKEQQAAGTRETDPSGAGENGYRIIREQTFEANLNPLGKVTFVSYEPEAGENSTADARFELKDGDRTVAVLDGIYKDNNREKERFQKVEAVSFPDYNSDGFNDIIIICSYLPMSGTEAGRSEVRIYSGRESGAFTLEKGLSEAADSALAEKTVQSVLGFLGAGKKNEAPAGWKQAYIDYLQAQDGEEWVGYQLIYLNDDDIPELVKIGNSEAVGCMIAAYAGGSVVDNQLNRLYFSYIEKGNLLCNSEGNMDSYYDLVYTMTDGQLSPVASGYYGAKDNSKLEFDENGDVVYQYEWNGTLMSREEYSQALNAVYDTSKARDGYAWEQYLSREQTIQKISEMQQ